MATTQNSRLAKFHSEALGGAQAEVHRVSGRERLSTCFAFDIDIEIEDQHELDLDAVLALPAALTFIDVDEEVRTVYGSVSEARDIVDASSGRLLYRLTLTPRVHALSLNQLIEVFIDKSVPDIIAGRLVAVGLKAGTDFELRLEQTYPEREFVVQYRESDLAFITRLAEHLGITFFFEHQGGADKIVFADDRVGTELGRVVPYAPDGVGRRVRSLQSHRRKVAAGVQLNDYDYMHPQLNLAASASVSQKGFGTYYEFGDNYTTEQQASRLALVRAEEIACRRVTFTATSDDSALCAGSLFTVGGSRHGDVELLVVEVEHTAEFSSHDKESAEPRYRNLVRAIPAALPFRPPRATPRPRVHGMHSGIIDADDKSEYASVDEHGRYKVKLLFDVSDGAGERASLPIRMAQPHTGQGYGLHFPLRPGTEVLVTFLDGDPDRPVIAACVPNALTPSVVSADNKVKNVLRTGGANEIDIDDTTDGQRIKLTTPHENTVFQLGSPNAPESGAVLSTDGLFSAISATGSLSVGNVANAFGDIKSAIFGDIVTWAGVFAWDRAAHVLQAASRGMSTVNALNEFALHSMRLIADQATEIGALLLQETANLEKLTAQAATLGATVSEARDRAEASDASDADKEEYDRAMTYYAQAQEAVGFASDVVSRLETLEKAASDAMVNSNAMMTQVPAKALELVANSVGAVAALLTYVAIQELRTKISKEYLAAGTTDLKTYLSTAVFAPMALRSLDKKLSNVSGLVKAAMGAVTGAGVGGSANVLGVVAGAFRHDPIGISKAGAGGLKKKIAGAVSDDTVHILTSDHTTVLRAEKLCYVEAEETLVHGKKTAVLTAPKAHVAGDTTELTATTKLDLKAADITGEATTGAIVLKMGTNSIEISADGITLSVGENNKIAMTASGISMLTAANSVKLEAAQIALAQGTSKATLKADSVAIETAVGKGTFDSEGAVIEASSVKLTVSTSNVKAENGDSKITADTSEMKVEGSSITLE